MTVTDEYPAQSMQEIPTTTTEIAPPAQVTLLSNKDLSSFLIMPGFAIHCSQLLIRLCSIFSSMIDQ